MRFLSTFGTLNPLQGTTDCFASIRAQSIKDPKGVAWQYISTRQGPPIGSQRLLARVQLLFVLGAVFGFYLPLTGMPVSK
jgi:hypothetical protein